jgi:hypothetical protein
MLVTCDVAAGFVRHVQLHLEHCKLQEMAEMKPCNLRDVITLWNPQRSGLLLQLLARTRGQHALGACLRAYMHLHCYLYANDKDWSGSRRT